MKRSYLSKLPKWNKSESAPPKGIQISKFLLATTIVLPLLLVGADMVSDGGVLAQMWPYTNLERIGAGITNSTAEEQENSSEDFDTVILIFLFGVSIFILFVSTWSLLFSNPLANLLRNARTTVMMNSRELERKDVPVPLGNS